MNTRIYKGAFGWTAKTFVPLEGKLALEFTTMKRSNGALSTTAIRVRLESGFASFVVFQDFNIRVLSEKARATEKAVADQHSRALAQLDAIKAQCAAHYEAATA